MFGEAVKVPSAGEVTGEDLLRFLCAPSGLAEAGIIPQGMQLLSETSSRV